MHAAHLFMLQKGELLLALRERADAMVREVEAAAEDDVLQADPNEYVNVLIERYKVESPVLKPEEMTLETSAAQVDISKDRSRPIRDRRSPLCVAGHRTVVHIPFVGDGSMFLLQPNRFTLQELQAKVGDGELFLEFEYPDDRAPDLMGEAWKLVAQLRQNLGNAQGDIANHNIELVGKARNAVEGRRNRIHQHRAHIAAQGIPLATGALERVVVERPHRPIRLRAMVEASEPNPKAFITWAHRDPGWEDSDEAAWTEAVYSFALLLRGYGIEVDVDLFHQSERGIDWTRFGPLRIRDTDWVIVVLSSAWRDRWEGRNAPTVGAGAVAEADVLRSIFGDDQREVRRKVVLVTLPSRRTEDLVPDGLGGVHRFTLRDLSPEEVMPLIRLIAGKPAYPAGPVGSLPELSPVQPIAPRSPEPGNGSG